MNSTEKRAAISIASIYAVRMLGLFLILPVFAVAAKNYQNATPMLIGLALGAYGLTQAIFQIPLGALSDRIGRKPVITMGLLLFALGSLIAALSTSIEWVIVGRALQGAGAIAAALLALCSDLTREENRTKIMAGVGASIGVAFTLALILGPLLQAWVGLSGIFWFSFALALLAIILLNTFTPDIDKPTQKQQRNFFSDLKKVIRHKELTRLNFGIFSLHFIITALFLVLPNKLDILLPSLQSHTVFYLVVFTVSFMIMVPVMLWSERRQRVKLTFTSAILLLATSLWLLSQTSFQLMGLGFITIIFFTCFNFLEANLPSLTSKSSPQNIRGTALGIYSTSQFLGAFLGGTLSGYLLQNFSEQSVFGFCVVLALLWYLIAITMPYQLNKRSKTWHQEESTKLS